MSDQSGYVRVPVGAFASPRWQLSQWAQEINPQYHAGPLQPQQALAFAPLTPPEMSTSPPLPDVQYLPRQFYVPQLSSSAARVLRAQQYL